MHTQLFLESLGKAQHLSSKPPVPFQLAHVDFFCLQEPETDLTVSHFFRCFRFCLHWLNVQRWP